MKVPMTAKRRPRRVAHANPGPLTDSGCSALAHVICDVRPAWEHSLVLSIIRAHRHSVPAATLALAAITAADDPDIVDPRAIGWSLRRAAHQPLPTCDTCGRRADECARRVGVDDEHPFVDKSGLTARQSFDREQQLLSEWPGQ